MLNLLLYFPRTIIFAHFVLYAHSTSKDVVLIEKKCEKFKAWLFRR